MSQIITLLHLSDIRSLALPPDEHFKVLLRKRLQDDLQSLEKDYRLRPDLVILSGDLTEEGLKSEFEASLKFIEDLTEHLKLSRHRVVIIPGDHDINRKHCEAYFLQCKADEKSPQPPFWPKWGHFVSFFQRFYRDQPDIGFTEIEPWTLFKMPDLRLVVAGLNSTMAESHQDSDHGYVSKAQLHWFAEKLEQYKQKGWLRIGVLHHNVQHSSVADPKSLQDAEDRRRILGDYVNLILHGYTDGGKSLSWLNGKIPILSAAGNVVLKGEIQPIDIPNQYKYQVIQLQHEWFKRWVRVYKFDHQCWLGDKHASTKEEDLSDGSPVNFENVDTTFTQQLTSTQQLESLGNRVSQEEDQDQDSTNSDSFLNRVKQVCLLRYKEAEIETHLRIGSPPIDYLEVSMKQHRVATTYLVGAIEHGVDKNILECFLKLCRRYQETDPRIGPWLVYGGEAASDELVQQAEEQQIRLVSFWKYQGLIDLRTYVQRQTQELEADPLYSPGFYVPQRMRYYLNEKEINTEDALTTIQSWLAKPSFQFVLILGDFGTGKTFLLHELARRMSVESSVLTPILIPMHYLEKSHSLNNLLAQHLAQTGIEYIDLKAFRYLLEQGRIALLFDGFDELTLRVTYDSAAEHLSSLIKGLSGAAKVVITSRTQYFVSDEQAKKAFYGQVEQLPNYQLGYLDSFDRERIRRFLFNRLKKQDQAEIRLQLINNIKGLPDLSTNPRMLSFIADLPEEELHKAETQKRDITAASLYELCINKWLHGESERAQPPGASPALSQNDRRNAVDHLALHLWHKSEFKVKVDQLTEEVGQVLENLFALQLDQDQATHQVGSGTLLVRDREGYFSFIHHSVLEWLVANRAATELKEGGGRSQTLTELRISDLTADFLSDLAGREQIINWAVYILDHGIGGHANNNASLVLKRLNVSARVKIRLSGHRLRSEDFSGQDLANVDLTDADLRDARLIESDLSYAQLTGARLIGADLSKARLVSANLENANCSKARLLGADLRGARFNNCVLRRAKLVGAKLDTGVIDDCDHFGYAPVCPPSIEPIVVPASSECNAVAWSPDGEWIASGHEDGSLYLWEAASGLEIRRFRGHESGISSIAFSPDGRTLASGSADRTLRVWDLAEGREIACLQGHKDWIGCIAFSPDGYTLASGSGDGMVQVWKLVNLQEQVCLTGHEDWVRSVAFSPDGHILASGAHDGKIRLWDLAQGQERACLTGHEKGKGIRSVAFNPDGRTLASGSEDWTVRLWDLTWDPGQLRLNEHEPKVLSVAFSPDGHTLALGPVDQEVLLEELVKGRKRVQGGVHGSSVLSIAFSPDGHTLALGLADRTVRLWDLTKDQERTYLTKDQKWTSLTGHEASVRSVAFSPGGNTLVSGSADRTVRLWDLVKGQECARLGMNDCGLWNAVLSPDGCTLAACQGESVQLWKLMEGRKLTHLKGHKSSIRGVAFSPDNHTLASCSVDKTIRLWDLAEGRERTRLTGHGDGVNSVAFSPDGRILVSGSVDKTIRLWDSKHGWELARLTGHEKQVWNVVFSPDGGTLASASDDQTVRLWDLEWGHQRTCLVGHEGCIWSVAFSPDGRMLASASDDRTVRLWALEDSKELACLSGHEGRIWSVAFSPDGRMLASASDDRTIRLWGLEKGTELACLRGHKSWVRSVAFSPDGHILASGSVDKTIRLWDLERRQELARLTGHEHGVLGVAFDPDGYLLASGSGDKTVRLWDPVQSRKLACLTGHKSKVWSVAFSPDGRTLASGSDDHTIRLWDVKQGRELTCLIGHESAVFNVAFSPDGRILVSASKDQTVRLWDLERGRELTHLRGCKSSMLSVAFSPNGRTLATGSDDKKVQLWDLLWGQERTSLTGHEDWVRSIAFSPDGHILASGSSDKTIRLWNLEQVQKPTCLRGHEDKVSSVAFSPDGRRLASGSGDKTVRLWDLTQIQWDLEKDQKLQELACLRGHEGGVRSVAFSPSGQILVSAAADNTMRLWNMASGTCLAILVHLSAGWVAYTPDGRYKLGGEVNGEFWHTIGLCRFEPGELDPYLPKPLRMLDEEILIRGLAGDRNSS